MTGCWHYDHNLCKHRDPKFCTQKNAQGQMIICPRLDEVKE